MGLVRDTIITALGGQTAKTNGVKPSPAPAVVNSELPITKGNSTRNGFLGTSVDGSATSLIEDTSLPKESLYTGIIYRAFTTIANRTAQVLINNTIVKDKNGEEVENGRDIHPYLKAIDESSTFTNFEFYYALSTYLQLTGFAPVLAIRNFQQREDGTVSSVGDIKEFKIISPYNIELLLSDADDTLLGYKETIRLHSGQTKQRELGVPHVLPIKTFNPFDNLLGFGAAMAANDHQYTNLEAGKYTRRSMRNNISTSGILTVAKNLDTAQRENFKQDLKTRYASDAADGSPIVAFGADSLGWQDLRQDMDKMALEKIHNMNQEDLLTVLGVSKTVMGIEQSGVTRETSRVQQDLFLMNIVMPLAQSILDELNQDYRNNYPAKWKNNKYVLEIDSPLSKDYEAEKIQTETLDVKMDVAKKMYQMGATMDSIVESLELPETLKFDKDPDFSTGTTEETGADEEAAGEGEDAPGNPIDEVVEDTNAHKGHKHVNGICPNAKNNSSLDELEYVSKTADVTAKNTLTMEQVVEIKKQREAFAEKMAQHELDFMDAYAKALGKEITQNDYVDEETRTAYLTAAAGYIADYYRSVVPVLAQAVADYRYKQFGYRTSFDMNAAIEKLIADRVKQTSVAHLENVENILSKLLVQALDEGWTREKMVAQVRAKFTEEISKGNARRLAVTETNNAFNKSQFWADEQFIAQNQLEERAYKKWVTYSPTPCPHCVALSERNEIPFMQNFVDVDEEFGAEFEKSDGTKVVRYIKPKEEWGPIQDGNAHPNCQCKYRLVLKYN